VRTLLPTVQHSAVQCTERCRTHNRCNLHLENVLHNFAALCCDLYNNAPTIALLLQMCCAAGTRSCWSTLVCCSQICQVAAASAAAMCAGARWFHLTLQSGRQMMTRPVTQRGV
jgi:hypothetical protein